MAATVQGTALEVGQQSSVPGYIVVSQTSGFDVKNELVENAAGADISDIIYQRKATTRFVLKALEGAVPETDFQKAKLCAVSGFTSLYVQDVSITKTKGVWEVDVTLIDKFSTDYGA